MMEFSAWLVWLAIGALLILLDYLLRTGRVLLALGFSCLCGAVVAVFTKDGLGFPGSVAVIIAGLTLYPVILSARRRETQGQQEPRDRNVGRLLRIVDALERPGRHFFFHFVLFCFFVFNGVAVVSDQNPSSQLLLAIATTGAVLAGLVAKRYTNKGFLVLLCGSFGLFFTGIVSAVIIVILRVYIHN